jgi:hypothetical protein
MMKKLFSILFLLITLQAAAQNLKRYGGTGWINTLHGGWFYNSHPSYGSGDSLKIVDYAELWRALNSIGGGGGSVAIGSLVTGGTAGRALFIGTNSLLQQHSLYGFDSTNGRLGVGTLSPSSRIDVTTDNLGVTQANTSGLSLVNTTAATVGAQQMSPALRLRGQGWKTNATAGSQSVDWQIDLLPVQGAANPSSSLRFRSSINGGAYSDLMTLSSAGALSLPGSIAVTGNVVGGAILALGSGAVGWSGASRFFNLADGVVRVTDQAGATFTRLIFGAANTSHPALKNSSGKLQVREGDDGAFEDLEVLDEAYDATTWNASNEVPTKNAVRDKIESMGSGAAAMIYQFVSTQQITVTNTTTETTIYGTGQGSAGIDGTANVTTGTQVILKGTGTIDTDGSVAGEVTFAFKFPTSTISLPVTGLANGLSGSTYTYEFKAIPLGTGTGQDYIWLIDIFVENNGTPVQIKVTGRETGVLTTTGTLTMDVTVDWNTADTDNTLVANFNTVEVVKK